MRKLRSVTSVPPDQRETGALAVADVQHRVHRAGAFDGDGRGVVHPDAVRQPVMPHRHMDAALFLEGLIHGRLQREGVVVADDGVLHRAVGRVRSVRTLPSIFSIRLTSWSRAPNAMT